MLSSLYSSSSSKKRGHALDQLDGVNTGSGEINETSDRGMSVLTNGTESTGNSNNLNSILDVMTKEELLKVAELKERLGSELLEKTSLYNDDYSLLRWVTGWDSKWDEIIPRYRKASEILSALGANDLDFETPDDVNGYISSLYPACEYFVGGLMGYDKEGNVVVVQSIGQIYPKVLVNCGRVSDVFRLSILEAALTMKLIKRQEQKHLRRLGIAIVFDLDGLCMDHIFPQTIKVYMNLLRILQDMYPDIAQKIFIINAPSLFASAYNLVKPAIAEKSRQKVKVLTSAYKDQLCEELGTENVYSHWGGTKIAERGREATGTLRMGGRPPDSFLYISLNNPEHIDDALLTKLNVPARSRREVEIVCIEEGQLLRWFFHTSSDIDFYALYKDDGEEENVLVVPKFRLHTDSVPEYNSVKCYRKGTYVLCFDNSFSTFFSKDVRFYAYCMDPNHNELDGGIDIIEDLNVD